MDEFVGLLLSQIVTKPSKGSPRKLRCCVLLEIEEHTLVVQPPRPFALQFHAAMKVLFVYSIPSECAGPLCTVII